MAEEFDDVVENDRQVRGWLVKITRNFSRQFSFIPQLIKVKVRQQNWYLTWSQYERRKQSFIC